jgi:exonuclease III
MNMQSIYMASITNNPRVKIDEVISTFVVEKEVDFICMSETWLHDQIDSTKIKIPGYQKPFRKDRKDKRGGGVCAYVTNNIIANRLTDLEPTDSDLMWIELSIQRKKVIVGVCYRPPGQNCEEANAFMDDFRQSLTQVMSLGAESIIITGDLNDTCEVWDSIHVHSELKNDLFDLVNLTDMVQLVNEPTHFTTSPSGIVTANLLDLIITDSPGYVKSVDLLPPLGSHHATLYLEFSITYSRDKSYMRHIWDYDKGNYDLLNISICNHPWDDILSAQPDIDSKTVKLTETFLDLCKGNILNRSIRVRPRDLPWMTQECKRLIRDRNRAYKKFQRSKTMR